MAFDLRSLFLAHSDALRQSLTRQFGDPVLAADLVQDTFLRLAQRPHAEPATPIADMRAYLARTARNLALNHVRQLRQRRTDSAARLPDLPAEQPSAEAELDARRRLLRLEAAMAELPLRTRQVFVATRLQGRTYADTARALGISESSVQKHLARALLHAMRHDA